MIWKTTNALGQEVVWYSEDVCDFANYVANLFDDKTKEQRFLDIAEELYNNLTTK